MASIFLLELAVLYQLANILIFSHASLATHLKSLRRWTLVVLALCTTTLAAMGRDVSTDGGTSALARLSLAQDFLDTGLLLILVIVSRTLAIPWRAIPAGVAVGWGISSLFNLVADPLVRTVTGSSILWGDVIRAGGFNACALIWLWYVARPPSAATKLVQNFPVADLHGEIIEAERTLRLLIEPKKGE